MTVTVFPAVGDAFTLPLSPKATIGQAFEVVKAKLGDTTPPEVRVFEGHREIPSSKKFEVVARVPTGDLFFLQCHRQRVVRNPLHTPWALY